MTLSIMQIEGCDSDCQTATTRKVPVANGIGKVSRVAKVPRARRNLPAGQELSTLITIYHICTLFDLHASVAGESRVLAIASERASEAQG